MSPSTVLYDPCTVRVLYTGSTADLTSQTRSSTLRKRERPSLQEITRLVCVIAPLLAFHAGFWYKKSSELRIDCTRRETTQMNRLYVVMS